MKLRLKLLLCLLTSTLIVWCCSCGQDTGTDRQRILRISPGKKIASLDPALAADTASQYMTAAYRTRGSASRKMENTKSDAVTRRDSRSGKHSAG